MKRLRLHERLQLRAIWHTQHLRKGRIIWEERDTNLIVDQGLAYMIGAALDSGTPKISNFFVGIYKANRAPLSTDTGTSYPGDANEATEYSEAARPAYNGVLTGSTIDNIAARAEFTFTASITVYGGFMISLSPKGIGGGTLINAKAFSAPRNPVATDVLRVMIQIALAGV
jgi:hypothetical protein